VIVSLDIIEFLDLSFRYKGKDRLASNSDEVLNGFEVIKKPKRQADLIYHGYGYMKQK